MRQKVSKLINNLNQFTFAPKATIIPSSLKELNYEFVNKSNFSYSTVIFSNYKLEDLKLSTLKESLQTKFFMFFIFSLLLPKLKKENITLKILDKVSSSNTKSDIVG